MSIISSTQTIAEDGISIAASNNHDDDATLVSSRQHVNWTPQSRFMRFYNTPSFPPSAPLAYVDGDAETDWAGAGTEGEGEMNGSFIANFRRFIIAKIKSFVDRLARTNAPVGLFVGERQ